MRIKDGDKGYTRYRHAIWCELEESNNEAMVQVLMDFAFNKAEKENKELVQIFCSSKVMDDMGQDSRKAWCVEFFLKA